METPRRPLSCLGGASGRLSRNAMQTYPAIKRIATEAVIDDCRSNIPWPAVLPNLAAFAPIRSSPLGRAPRTHGERMLCASLAQTGKRRAPDPPAKPFVHWSRVVAVDAATGRPAWSNAELGARWGAAERRQSAHHTEQESGRRVKDFERQLGLRSFEAKTRLTVPLEELADDSAWSYWEKTAQSRGYGHVEDDDSEEDGSSQAASDEESDEASGKASGVALGEVSREGFERSTEEDSSDASSDGSIETARSRRLDRDAELTVRAT